MVHQRCHRNFTHSKTSLAERMTADVSVTDFLPRISVPLMLVVATGKMLVVPLHKSSMFLAVACPAVGQVGTAAVAAGAFRFCGHGVHLVSGMKKPPQGLLPLEVLFVHTFLQYTLSGQGGDTQHDQQRHSVAFV